MRTVATFALLCTVVASCVTDSGPPDAAPRIDAPTDIDAARVADGGLPDAGVPDAARTIDAGSRIDSGPDAAPGVAHFDIFLPRTSIPIGVSYRAVGLYNDGTETDVTASATWSTSDSSIATVDSGVVTAVAAGDASITGTYQGLNSTIDIHVSSATLARMFVAPGIGRAPLGQSFFLHAIGVYTDQSAHNITELANIYTSPEDSSTIQVINNEIQVTIIGPTTFDVIAYLGPPTGFQVISVNTSTLDSLTLELGDGAPDCGAAAPIHPDGGYTTFVRAMGNYADGRTHDITDMVPQFTSTSPTVATIDSRGVLTTGTPGTTTITATIGAVSDSMNITVGSGTLQNITVSPTPLVTAPGAGSLLPTGTTVPYAASGTFDFGGTTCRCDITNVVRWSTSASAIARVSDSGLVMGTAAGSVDITATIGAEVGVNTVTMTAPPVDERHLLLSGAFSDGVSSCTSRPAETVNLDMYVSGPALTIAVVPLGRRDVSEGWIAPDGTFATYRFDGRELWSGQIAADGSGTAHARYRQYDNCIVDFDVTLAPR